MTFDEYTEVAMRLEQQPEIFDQFPMYAALALASEVGEVAGAVTKQIRNGDEGPTDLDVLDELGDVLFFVNRVAHQLGFSLDDVATANVAKLQRLNDSS